MNSLFLTLIPVFSIPVFHCQPFQSNHSNNRWRVSVSSSAGCYSYLRMFQMPLLVHLHVVECLRFSCHFQQFCKLIGRALSFHLCHMTCHMTSVFSVTLSCPSIDMSESLGHVLNLHPHLICLSLLFLSGVFLHGQCLIVELTVCLLLINS